jgi:hypothetical protein
MESSAAKGVTNAVPTPENSAFIGKAPSQVDKLL